MLLVADEQRALRRGGLKPTLRPLMVCRAREAFVAVLAPS
jgi:hypothetical protein